MVGIVFDMDFLLNFVVWWLELVEVLSFGGEEVGEDLKMFVGC